MCEKVRENGRKYERAKGNREKEREREDKEKNASGLFLLIRMCVCVLKSRFNSGILCEVSHFSENNSR